MITLTQTALHQKHIEAGAKMVEFAGFEMPVSYAGLVEEHLSVRNECGMFDVSHMGEFRVSGPEALDLIQWVTTNDVRALVDGKVQYSCMPNGQAGIVDDLLVYRLREDEYMLVVNASNRSKDLNWIQNHNRWNASVIDESDQWSLLAVQGPKAHAFLQPICDIPGLEYMEYYTFRSGHVLGRPCLVSATGYTGAGGFELYMANEDASSIWSALLEAGVKPCGLGARDTLRLEAGFCLYGNDIDDQTSPIAAGLGWITKFNEPFIDSERFQLEKSKGSHSLLRGLVVQERGIPRHGYEIENEKGEVIGHVTSGTQSPSLGHGIALGYIAASESAIGSTVYVRIRKNKVAAKVVRPGFLPKND